MAKDATTAHLCYERAALAGNVAGMFNAATNFMNGDGTGKDLQAARELFKAVVVMPGANDVDRARGPR